MAQEILEKCGIETARAVVVTINDAVWINKIVASVRKIRPDIRLVVRLQYFMDEARCLNLEGVETVIAEAETAKQITGIDFPVLECDRREGDAPILVGSSEKAQKILGWQPKYADLKTIIDHAWRWHQKRHGPAASSI